MHSISVSLSVVYLLDSYIYSPLNFICLFKDVLLLCKNVYFIFKFNFIENLVLRQHKIFCNFLVGYEPKTWILRKSNLKNVLTVQTVLDHWFCSKNCPANIILKKISRIFLVTDIYVLLIYKLLIFRKSCLWRLCREGLNLQVVRGLQMMLSTILSISLKRLIWALLKNLSCKGWLKHFLKTLRFGNHAKMD